MNAQFPTDRDPLEDTAVDLNAALAAELGLSEAMVQKIHEVMQALDTSFVDAAGRLGILRPETIEQALVKISKVRPPEDVGMIETAIRRISADRRIVLRQGERVSPSRQLILAHDPDNPRSERLRALRTELLLLHETGHGANMVAVLSAGSGEGRSQLCAELAISFAQLGRRTLLVDTDMRKPQQHVLFGSPNLQGLSQAIARRERPYFHPVEGLPFMNLLTAGPIPPNPLELLSDGRFSSLLNEWRNSYEFVVLDTPPVSQCADGLAVATLAASALVLSRAQHTTFKSTRALLRRLASTHSRLLGAVVNHF
ncbi:MAG TPA: CpsD/CapB family tyrosine-protein kinase [Steroidobacteraceae bacterium]|nr:CpsD/CapB family tyrosine-protein kinase [Steroidobacteraceae bacterium]